MNWLAVRGICLLVIGCFAANGFAQTSVSADEIFVDDGTGVVITNGRRCVDPNGPTATARCREVTTEEARPCPSGSCFSWGSWLQVHQWRRQGITNRAAERRLVHKPIAYNESSERQKSQA